MTVASSTLRKQRSSIMDHLDAFSFASDIISVLTFFVATVASIAAYYALTVEADSESAKVQRLYSRG
jgi:hypothetical protein